MLAHKHFLTFKGMATDCEPHYIPGLFTQSGCHQRCSLNRDWIQMTHFSFYDHDATQSECRTRNCIINWACADGSIYPILCQFPI